MRRHSVPESFTERAGSKSTAGSGWESRPPGCTTFKGLASATVDWRATPGYSADWPVVKTAKLILVSLAVTY